MALEQKKRVNSASLMQEANKDVSVLTNLLNLKTKSHYEAK
jgi:hypothetical protein